MTSTVVVAVKACACETTLAALTRLLPNYDLRFVSVPDQTPVLSFIREIDSLCRKNKAVLLNLLCGGETSASVEEVNFAMLVDQCKIPYSGCRAKTLCYTLDVLFMMIHYGDIPLPRFHLVKDSESCDPKALEHLTGSLLYGCCNPLVGPTCLGHITQAGDTASAVLSEQLELYGPLLVWEASGTEAQAAEVEVLVAGCLGEEPAVILNKSVCDTDRERILQLGKRFCHHVLGGVGNATVRFGKDREGEYVLRNVHLNPSVPAVLSALGNEETQARLVQGMIQEAGASFPAKSFEIRLYPNSLGYHLCAARRLAKGEIVFNDEGRSFAIVTRPFVQKNWDAELKKTFTEYAWPLDSEGHVYAIWESDPLRWRPINHSCDPNLVFDAPHSLNVVAVRDISEGEDLSMDYATFCDATMKPFQCGCGAADCRGTVSALNAPLDKYGENSWLRRAPADVKPLS